MAAGYPAAFFLVRPPHRARRLCGRGWVAFSILISLARPRASRNFLSRPHAPGKTGRHGRERTDVDAPDRARRDPPGSSRRDHDRIGQADELRRDGRRIEPLRPPPARPRHRRGRGLRGAAGKPHRIFHPDLGIAARRDHAGADLLAPDRARGRLHHPRRRSEAADHQRPLCRHPRRHPPGVSGAQRAGDGQRRCRGFRRRAGRAARDADPRPERRAADALFLRHHRPPQGHPPRPARGSRSRRAGAAAGPCDHGHGDACRWLDGLSLARPALPPPPPSAGARSSTGSAGRW